MSPFRPGRKRSKNTSLLSNPSVLQPHQAAVPTTVKVLLPSIRSLARPKSTNFKYPCESSITFSSRHGIQKENNVCHLQEYPKKMARKVLWVHVGRKKSKKTHFVRGTKEAASVYLESISNHLQIYYISVVQEMNPYVGLFVGSFNNNNVSRSFQCHHGSGFRSRYATPAICKASRISTREPM